MTSDGRRKSQVIRHALVWSGTSFLVLRLYLDNPAAYDGEEGAAVEIPAHERGIAGFGPDRIGCDGQLSIKIEDAHVGGRAGLQRSAGQAEDSRRNRAHLGDGIGKRENARRSEERRVGKEGRSGG